MTPSTTDQLNSVLLIEDDFDDVYYHRRIIEESGLVKHLQVCRDASSALDYLQNQGEYGTGTTIYPPPDLIFLDLNLPKMNGWEFLEVYQQLPESIIRQPVMTILTTSLNPDDERRALSMGIVKKFFIKPLRVDELTRAMHKLFPHRFDQ